MDRRSTVVTKRGRGEMYGNKLNAAQSRLSPELNLRQLQKSQSQILLLCSFHEESFILSQTFPSRGVHYEADTFQHNSSLLQL